MAVTELANDYTPSVGLAINCSDKLLEARFQQGVLALHREGSSMASLATASKMFGAMHAIPTVSLNGASLV